MSPAMCLISMPGVPGRASRTSQSIWSETRRHRAPAWIVIPCTPTRHIRSSPGKCPCFMLRGPRLCSTSFRYFSTRRLLEQARIASPPRLVDERHSSWTLLSFVKNLLCKQCCRMSPCNLSGLEFAESPGVPLSNLLRILQSQWTGSDHHL